MIYLGGAGKKDRIFFDEVKIRIEKKSEFDKMCFTNKSAEAKTSQAIDISKKSNIRTRRMSMFETASNSGNIEPFKQQTPENVMARRNSMFVDQPGKENQPHALKMPKNVPLDAKGRKRETPSSVLENENQAKKRRLSNIHPSSTCNDGILVNLMESPPKSNVTSGGLFSQNIKDIMNDLAGINFASNSQSIVNALSPTTSQNVQAGEVGLSKKIRPLPALIPIAPALKDTTKLFVARNSVVQMILNRTDSNVNESMVDFEPLHYSSDESN